MTRGVTTFHLNFVTRGERAALRTAFDYILKCLRLFDAEANCFLGFVGNVAERTNLIKVLGVSHPSRKLRISWPRQQLELEGSLRSTLLSGDS